jgi:hypothetical protein
MGYKGVSVKAMASITTKQFDCPSGNSDLEEHLAIRPTSETGMYPCTIYAFIVELVLTTQSRLC